MKKTKVSIDSFIDSDLVCEIDEQGYLGVYNVPLNEYLDKNVKEFFVFIGYLTFQVSLLEDSIKQSIIRLTDDYGAVERCTNRINLGSLLDLYELIFFSVHKSNDRYKQWYLSVRSLMQKTNKFRNEAAHSGWMYAPRDTSKFFYESKNGMKCLTLDQMRQRAAFAHSANEYFSKLEAATGAEGYDPSIINEAENDLDELINTRKVTMYF